MLNAALFLPERGNEISQVWIEPTTIAFTVSFCATLPRWRFILLLLFRNINKISHWQIVIAFEILITYFFSSSRVVVIEKNVDDYLYRALCSANQHRLTPGSQGLFAYHAICGIQRKAKNEICENKINKITQKYFLR